MKGEGYVILRKPHVVITMDLKYFDKRTAAKWQVVRIVSKEGKHVN